MPQASGAIGSLKINFEVQNKLEYEVRSSLAGRDGCRELAPTSDTGPIADLGSPKENCS